MLEFTIKNKQYAIPNCWEELTPIQFTQILPYLLLVLNEKISVPDARKLATMLLCKLNPKDFSFVETQTSSLPENIYRLSNCIDFLFRIKYENEKGFRRLKKEVREQLYRFLPEELNEKQIKEVYWAKKQKYTVIPDLVFARNLLPTIGYRNKKLKGYTFQLDGQMLECSLTFIQLVHAQELSREYFRTSSEALLTRFIATLYFPGKYNPEKVSTIQIPRLDALTKQAILYNFNAIQAFLYTRTKYKLLFDDPEQPNQKTTSNDIGLMGVNYSLMESGFPDQENSPMLKVFDIMFHKITSNVKNLYADGLTIDKISEATRLPLRKINQILKNK